MRFLILLSAYMVLGKLGLHYATLSPSATAVWAPTGIAIAMLILFGRNLWPAVFLGALAVNVTTAGTIATSLGIALGNTLEAVIATYLVNRFAGGKQVFESARNVFFFSLFGGAVGAAIGASIGTLSLALGGLLTLPHYAATWATWWVGDVSGALIVAPFIILWIQDPRIKLKKDEVVEVILFSALLILFALYALVSSNAFLYLVTPVFIWGAFRFRQRETATAVFGLTAFFLVETARGIGPFFHEIPDLNGALILLEALMDTTFITMMALTATVVERERTEKTVTAYTERIAREKAVDAAIIASVGEGLVFVDRDARVVIINPAAEKMLGLKVGEAIGKKFDDVVAMQDEEGNVISVADRPLAHVLATGKRLAMEPLMPTRYYVRKDGTRFPVSFVASAVEMEGEVIGALDIFRDVTQGKEIDRAKSDFVSLASHQLRTPLSIISMYAELLRRQSGLFEKHDERECRKYSKEIEDATRRMAELINDLLNVSRIDAQTLAVNPTRADLKKVVGSIIQSLMPKFDEKKLTLSVRYREELPRLTTDVQLLAVILQNLFMNAIKYTPRGGKIRVTVGSEDGRATFTVADTGYGIPKSQQGEIFKKLFRASNVRRVDSEGSGLGLYIARSMAERLGGSIDFKSVEKKGSTFTLRLPISSFRVSAHEGTAADGTSGHLKISNT